MLCLRSIISSIFSSSVPTQTNLCTCTLRVWPMRKARSVAWFSTAGFHQRSKWKTWLARGQVEARAAGLEREHEERRAVRRPGSAPPSRRAASSARRRAGTAPRARSVSCRCRRRISPISANCVKTSARSPAASTSSSISARRASLPERPAIARVVAQELRRMIADLLELRERGQHQSLALDALGGFDLPLGVAAPPPRRATPARASACRRPSSPSSRAGRAMIVRVGLQPPQDERRR